MKVWSILCLPLSVVLPLGAEQEVYVSSSDDFSLKRGSASAPPLLTVQAAQNVWGVAYRSADNAIYFSNPTSGEINRHDLDTNGLSTVVSEAGAVFHGIDTANEALYALRSGSDDVVRYDLPSTTPNVLTTGLMRPNDIAVDAGRNRMFVTDSGLDLVFEYDLSGTLIRQWPLSGAWGAAVSPVDGAVYISRFESGELWRNALGTTTFSRIASGLDGPRGVEVERSGEVYVLEANLDRISKVDVSTAVVSPTAYVPAFNGHAMVVQESLDRDGDYLGDDWEVTHFGALNVSDGSQNTDGDAHSDFLEYAFMGDPMTAEGNLTKNYKQNGTEGFALDLNVVNDPNLRVRFLLSNDLNNWVSVAPESTAAVVDTNYQTNEFDVLESSYFIPSEGRLFFKATAEPNH